MYGNIKLYRLLTADRPYIFQQAREDQKVEFEKQINMSCLTYKRNTSLEGSDVASPVKQRRWVPATGRCVSHSKYFLLLQWCPNCRDTLA